MGKKDRILSEIQSRKIQKITIVVSATIVITILAWRINYLMQLDHNEKVYDRLRTDYVGESIENNQEDNSKENEVNEQKGLSKIIDIQALQETNDDIYAWITVDNTQIDYPVLQNSEDDYYLNHCIDLKKGLPGCVYSNGCSQRDFSSWNTVIYGHNMKNGTMFGCLKIKEDFFDELNTITIYTENYNICYQIFALVEFPDKYLPETYNEENIEDREQYIKDIRSIAAEDGYINENIDVNAEKQLLTLSTCIKGKENKRLLVVAVRQK